MNEDDRKFLLDLIRDAHIHNIVSFEYNNLKVVFRQLAATPGKPTAFRADWSNTLPIPTENKE
jgi:hypothetical protein